MLPEFELLKNQATSEIVGSGTLRLDRMGLRYTGTKNGEPFTFHIPSVALTTYDMCTNLSRFYTFVNGEFVEYLSGKLCCGEVLSGNRGTATAERRQMEGF